MTGPTAGPGLTVPALTSPDLTAPRLTPTEQPATAVDTDPVSWGSPTNSVADVGDAYLIRSEEHLRVSTVPIRARRVRLEKYVVTETRTITVQVSREEVRLVDMDLDDDLVDVPTQTIADGDTADGGRWLTLSEERVAITTEVIPVERVRLGVYSVTEQQDITDTVRREQVQLDPLPVGTQSDPHTDLPRRKHR